jgi:hypothetical protein
MFINHLAKRFLNPLESGSSRKQSFAAKPAVEALESRSLMDANAFVRGLYANVLQRSNPSDAEVNAWVNRIDAGMSLQAVNAAFVGSTERLDVVVKSDYTNLLGRAADQAGLNYWVQQLANGMTQDQVEASMASSEEFFMVHGSTNTEFIQGLYQTVLHRNASDADLTYWNNQLSVVTFHQTTPRDVALRIVSSDEAHLRDVDTIFSEILHRSADDTTRANWASFLDQGGSQAQIITALVNSNEYLGDYGV